MTVKNKVYLNGKQIKSDTWDMEYTVYIPEGMYGLLNPKYKNKKVLIIERYGI